MRCTLPCIHFNHLKYVLSTNRCVGRLIHLCANSFCNRIICLLKDISRNSVIRYPYCDITFVERTPECKIPPPIRVSIHDNIKHYLTQNAFYTFNSRVTDTTCIHLVPRSFHQMRHPTCWRQFKAYIKTLSIWFTQFLPTPENTHRNPPHLVFCYTLIHTEINFFAVETVWNRQDENIKKRMYNLFYRNSFFFRRYPSKKQTAAERRIIKRYADESSCMGSPTFIP